MPWLQPAWSLCFSNGTLRWSDGGLTPPCRGQLSWYIASGLNAAREVSLELPERCCLVDSVDPCGVALRSRIA